MSTSSRVTVHLERDSLLLDEDNEWPFLQYLLIFISLCFFLLMSLALTIIWVIMYHDGFIWKTNSKHMFNFHPVFMVGGFVTLGGYSLVIFRMSPCCGITTIKVFHLLFYILIIPCVVLGLCTTLLGNRPNFTLIHTWIGLLTIVMFITEFVLGILAYGILLFFGKSVEYVRLGMVTIHACTGKIIFMLSIAACLTGLSLKQAEDNTSASSLEFLVINFIGICIMFSALLVMSILRRN